MRRNSQGRLRISRVAPAFLTLVSLGAMPSAARAQEELLPGASWGAAPAFTTWHFSSPLGGVHDVQQFAIPLRARTMFGDRWTLDFNGSAMSSSATVTSGSATSSLSLSGISDIRARISGAIVPDRLLVTGGINLPTGTTQLNADQAAVLQAVAAPALHMPAPALGLGTGLTIGAIGAQQSGDWALALGAAAEARSEYTPIALVEANGTALTKLTPGTALHLTFGADRPVGEEHVSLLLATDLYSKDKIVVGASAGGTASSSYTLGPQITAIGRLDLAVPGWHDAAAGATLKFRSAFTDASGATVSGSSGTYLDAAAIGVRGAPDSRGFVLGADIHLQSGLSFTDAIVGASTTAAGVIAGVELPQSSAVVRLTAHAQYGTFGAGSTHTTGFGLTLVVAVASRGGAR
jgi:hypothetical protein